MFASFILLGMDKIGLRQRSFIIIADCFSGMKACLQPIQMRNCNHHKYVALCVSPDLYTAAVQTARVSARSRYFVVFCIVQLHHNMFNSSNCGSSRKTILITQHEYLHVLKHILHNTSLYAMFKWKKIKKVKIKLSP
jgi:hypothetical protein